ncbi:hypothetical protein GQ42DRAFT_173264 [Ramicandelaber brevisporus]|nr:hypothetical protein GQ42DRAFT_173264 [Ramicandelaber brevisporus]
MAPVRIISIATILATALASLNPAAAAVSSSSGGPQPTGVPGIGFNAECLRLGRGFAMFRDGCNECGCTAFSPGLYCTAMWCPIYDNPAAKCVNGVPPRVFAYENLKCLCLPSGVRVCIPIDRDFLQPYGSESPGCASGTNDPSQKNCQSTYGSGTFVDPVSGYKCACGAKGHIYCQVPSN